MGIVEEIQQYQSEGRSGQEISQILMQRGYNPKDVSDILSQMQIKEAVSGGQQVQQEVPAQADYSSQYSSQAPQADYSAYPPQDSGYGAQDYSGYGAGISTDSMSEIAEQAVIEKLSPLRKRLEEVMDLKAVMESKITYLDDRLLRIERTIDRLQLSVLQKVGEYVSNVEDIKKEMQESNKTVRSLLDKGHHHSK